MDQQPMSPLEPLDPHKLREMVVDKQQSIGTPHQQTHWSQQTGGGSTMSPSSVDSPHSIVNQRLSSGSDAINSPFQARPASQQPNQQFDFSNPRTPMYQPGSVTSHPIANASPSKPILPQQQHMMSPIGRSPQTQAASQMPPASPFQRSNSAASGSCPSPYPQGGTGPYPSQQVYPHGYAGQAAAAAGVRLPPNYPTSVPPQQGQYQGYPGQQPPQWTGQNQQHYMMPQQRMPYGPPGSAYQSGMPPPPSPAQTTMMFPRPQRPTSSAQQQQAYPNVGKPQGQQQQPQTPGSQGPSVGTPPIQGVPLSPYPNQQPQGAGNYHFIQQQRLQQFQTQQQSPIRSPFMPSGGPQPNQSMTPGTPTNTTQIRYGTPQQQQANFPNPSGHDTPQTPGTPLSAGQQQQQRFPPQQTTHPNQLSNGQLNQGIQPGNMRSPPLVSPAQAQLPPHSIARAQMPPQQQQMPPQNMPQPVHPQLQQQHSMDMSRANIIPNGPSTPLANRQIPPGYPSSQPITPSVQTPQGNAPPLMGGPQPQGGMMRMASGPMRMPPPYTTQVFQLMGQRQYPIHEVFLAGCVFFFDETCYIQDPSDLYTRLRYYGADVEANPNALGHNQHITHLVSENLSGKARQMIKHPVRSVTLTWLNDVLMKRKLEVPWRAAHLPSPWPDNQLPAMDKLISSEGFDEFETQCIRALCKRIGAQYTSYFTPKHAALISKCESGQRSYQANEWKIPILNYAWLSRLYFGNVHVINEIGRDVHRPPGDALSAVDSSPYTLERIADLTMKLLHPWRFPIMVNDELVNRAFMTRHQIETDPSIFTYKKHNSDFAAPTDEQIQEAIEIFKRNNMIPNYRLFFDQLPEQLFDELTRKARFLGAQLAGSIIECTHYITGSLRRTPQLLEALARGKELVDPSWVEQSFRHLQFLDPFDFYTYDPNEERRFRFSALNTIYRARERPIFEDVVFHLGPSVQFSVDFLRGLIEAAGGTVELEKPTYKKIAEYIRYDKTYLVVINEADAMEYSYLYEKRIPIFNEELVFMSIMRHHIDTDYTFRLNPPVVSDVQTSSKPSSSNAMKFSSASRQQKGE